MMTDLRIRVVYAIATLTSFMVISVLTSCSNPASLDSATDTSINATLVSFSVEATLRAQENKATPTPAQNAPAPIATVEPIRTSIIVSECVVHEDEEDYASAGDCYLEMEDFESAATSYKQLALDDPSNFWVFEQLANVYQLCDEWVLALGAGQQALSLAQTPIEQRAAHLRIGTTYFSMDEYQLAIQYFYAGLQIGPSVETYRSDLQIWLAWAYQADGQDTDACDYFRRALESAQTQDYAWAKQRAEEGLRGCE